MFDTPLEVYLKRDKINANKSCYNIWLFNIEIMNLGRKLWKAKWMFRLENIVVLSEPIGSCKRSLARS